MAVPFDSTRDCGKNTMKRWDFAGMLDIGSKLFAQIYKQKHHANLNQDVHFMIRELDEWLVQSIQSLIDGSYIHRFLRRIISKMIWSTQMVIDGVSPRRITSYLHPWLTWWVRTTEIWSYQELLSCFLNVCSEPAPSAIAAGLFHSVLKKLRPTQSPFFESAFLIAG
jgi:hypothetical protein